MKKSGILASLLAALCMSTAPSAQSQELYWTTSGMFGPFNIQGLIPTFPTARDITIPSLDVDSEAPERRGGIRHR